MDNSLGKSGALLHNLLLFGRLLRGLGLDISPGRMIDVVQAIPLIEIGRREDFKATIRSLLVHDKADIELFEAAFDAFWKNPNREQMSDDLANLVDFRPEEPQTLITPPALDQMNDGPEEPPADDNDDDYQEVIELTQTYSRREVLRQKDFAEMSSSELAQVQRFMAELVWQLGTRQTRRLRSGRGKLLDLRRAMRQNMRYDGELLEWPRREKKQKPRPLVILADISGSMERYTRLLISFSYSLATTMQQQVETFVFSTRLTRITRQLEGKDLDDILKDVGSSVPDWSGGTRIGDALKRFNLLWGRRVLGRGAVVLIISDGWDRGDPELLGEEMARLHRNSHRVIWLNPLLSSERFEPLTRGLVAAMPYVDDFLPVHNLASLEALAGHLQVLDEVNQRRRRRRTLTGSAFIK